MGEKRKQTFERAGAGRGGWSGLVVWSSLAALGGEPVRAAMTHYSILPQIAM